MLDLDYHARLKGRHKSLQLDGYGISADLDRRENVSAVSARVGGFRNGGRFVLKKDFSADCSLTGGVSHNAPDRPTVNLRERASAPENHTEQEATRLYQPNESRDCLCQRFLQ
jgi:hypothetical protein